MTVLIRSNYIDYRTVLSTTIRITLKDNAVPVFHKSGSVPAHLVEKVRANLDRDEKLGVIRRLPQNTPTEWCARLVWATKPNGDLRRTIDLTGLNKASQRQMHMTTTPYEQASQVPENTVKTVMDACAQRRPEVSQFQHPVQHIPAPGRTTRLMHQRGRLHEEV